MRIASRPPLRRLALIDRLIRSGSHPNASTLARQLEVNTRTVHRDLEFLRDSLGAPLEFSHDHNGYYYRDPDFALPVLRLSEGELIALFLAERLMQQYRGTSYAKDIATAFQKLTAGLPDEVTIDLSHLDEVFSVRPPVVASSDAARFRQLTRAAREGRQLELVYWTASRDDTCRRVVDPYHLVSVDGDWFLVAYCHLREDIRIFAPGRIRGLKETGMQFERPADFSIAAYLDGTFRAVRGIGPPRRVRLRFTPEAARYVRERQWHPSQQVQEQADGALVLTVMVNHLFEVKRWALSHGSSCEVLEPPELRKEVKADLASAAALYLNALRHH